MNAAKEATEALQCTERQTIEKLECSIKKALCGNNGALWCHMHIRLHHDLACQTSQKGKPHEH